MGKKRKILFVLLLLIAAAAVGYLVYYFTSQYANNQIYDDLKNQVKETETPTPTATPTVEETPAPEITETPQVTMVPTTVDFQSLWDINPEVAAWVNIPGTRVDYPVMLSQTDDSYYLNHTIEGAAGYPGSIYMESINKADFSDFNTVLYGHNMKAGTMFADLHKYDNLEYMEQNHQVIIDTPEQKITYEIFAAVTYSDAHIVNQYDFLKMTDRQAFIDSIDSAPGIHREGITVNTDSQIITLSTCITGQDNNRLLVEAVRVYE